MKALLIFAYVSALISIVVAHKIPLIRKQHTPLNRRRISAHSSHKRNINSDTLFSASSILAPLSIGTPAQQLWVLLDTASSDLALFSSAYSSQFQSSSATKSALGKAYNSGSSTTYKSTSNSFENQYGSGDTQTYFQAQVGQETLAIEKYTLTGQKFGLINQGNVSYGPSASGILGLAFEAASTGLKATPPIQQLYFDGALPQPIFSFALMRPSTVSEETSQDSVSQPGGIFTLGELDTEQYQGEIGWSSLVTPDNDSKVPTKWLAKLDNITINGALVTGSQGMVANFDTGSSASRASGNFLNNLFAKASGSLMDSSDGYYIPCGDNTPTAMNMTISMGGVSVAIEPLDLLYKTQSYVMNKETYCLSTLSDTSTDEYDIQIGDDILRSLFVAFSYNPPRVGLAPQSSNVHNQGAKPSYAFESSNALVSRSLSSPQNTASVSLASVDAVPTSAVSHVSVVEEQGMTYTIQTGGLYASGVTASMQTVVASSTPVQLGSTVSASIAPGSTQGSVDTSKSGSRLSSSSSASSPTSAPSTIQLLGCSCLSLLLIVSTAFYGLIAC